MAAAAAAASGEGDHAIAREEIAALDAAIAQVEDRIAALQQQRSDLVRQREVARGNAADALLAVRETDWTRQFPWSKEVERVKCEVFGLHGPWRANQREAINVVLSGHDCMLIMRSGGGKSLTFQVPAAVMKGTVVVISPLVALMDDQVRALDALPDLRAAMLCRSVPVSEQAAINRRLSGREEPGLDILYVTPEKLVAGKNFRAALQRAYDAGLVGLFAIDEAHCCSQWGHDFRHDYVKLSQLRQLFPRVPILAVTATATRPVRRSVAAILSIQRAVTLASSFNRPNLRYRVRLRPHGAAPALDALTTFIAAQSGAGIVYTLSRADTERLADGLRARGVPAAPYHAGMGDDQRARMLRRWQAGQCRVIVATVAFGMGVDKADVRFVVHMCLPKSIEGYYQETGRAGRDGEPASCLLMYRPQDASRLASLVYVHEETKRGLQRMLSLCLGYAQCRRQRMAVHFSEHRTVTHSACDGGCDVCEAARGGAVARSGQQPPPPPPPPPPDLPVLDASARGVPRVPGAQRVTRTLDASPDARGLLQVLAERRGRNANATLKQLVDAWAVKRKAALVSTARAPALSREQLAYLVAHCLVAGVLQPAYHVTDYAVNAYLAPGPEAPRVEGKEVAFLVEFPAPGTGKGGSAGKGGNPLALTAPSPCPGEVTPPWAQANGAAGKIVAGAGPAGSGRPAKRPRAATGGAVVDLLSSDEEEEGRKGGKGEGCKRGTAHNGRVDLVDADDSGSAFSDFE